MTTMKQVKAVELIVENRGNISKSMREAGYTDATAKNPKNLTESKGFAEILEECGLTDTLLTDALVHDIKAKVGERKAELELGFKVRGRLKDNVSLESGGQPIQFIINRGQPDPTK